MVNNRETGGGRGRGEMGVSGGFNGLQKVASTPTRTSQRHTEVFECKDKLKVE